MVPSNIREAWRTVRGFAPELVRMDGARALRPRTIGHLRSIRQPCIVPLRHRDPDKTVAQHLILGRYLDSPKMAFLACQGPGSVTSRAGREQPAHRIGPVRARHGRA